MSSHTQGDRIVEQADVVGQRLQALVDRTVRKRRIAHAIFGVADGGGGARWIVAAGDARRGERMRPDTPFFVASVTKRFIAALVLQAAERGEFALDDPITALLPDELTDGLHVRKGVDHTPSITVHHLLTHTSGLPDYFDKPRNGPSLYKQLWMARTARGAWTMSSGGFERTTVPTSRHRTCPQPGSAPATPTPVFSCSSPSSNG